MVEVGTNEKESVCVLSIEGSPQLQDRELRKGSRKARIHKKIDASPRSPDQRVGGVVEGRVGPC